jgi:hypothetical protein
MVKLHCNRNGETHLPMKKMEPMMEETRSTQKLAKLSENIEGLLRHILSASNHKITVPRIPKTNAKRL